MRSVNDLERRDATDQFTVLLRLSARTVVRFDLLYNDHFYTRDAMRKRGLCYRRMSVRLSHAGIVPKWIKIKLISGPCSPTTTIFCYRIWLRNSNGKGSLSTRVDLKHYRSQKVLSSAQK